MIENSKQKELRDFENFAIDIDQKLDSVELKRKSSRGEFKSIVDSSFLKK